MLFLALLLGSATSPPPDDDDRKPAVAAPVQSPARDDEEERAPASSRIVITARRLDTARTRIDAALGATVYSVTNETIENRPGGETGSISDILAQAPGVSLSGKTVAVRGSAINQVRINNVVIPEAISDPSDLLSSRLADTTRLLTGTLPAQFGFAPAGVISITTKNGLYEHGGQAELFAGSDGMFEPAFEWAGSIDATSLFASSSLERDRSTVADADGASARDRRSQVEGLGFADHVIDENNRASMIFGGSRERHTFGATGVRPGSQDSGDAYITGTFQHSDEGFTFQSSLFGGVASDRAHFSQNTHERRTTAGAQIDASEELGAAHILRFGLLVSRSSADELSEADRSHAHRTSAALYVQDEWKLTPDLTFNPGVRSEWLRGFAATATIEPRASLVWESAGGLTAHVGYARYASALPLGGRASAMPNERDDYFDAGVQQKLGAFIIGLDAYARAARNYITEHTTIGSAVRVPFEFDRVRIRGMELSATYGRGPVGAWANLALSKATGRTIIGGEGLFSPEVLAAASSRSTPLGTERPVTASGGLTWRLGKLNLSGDVLASSGAVRTLVPDQPNGSRRAAYAVFGLAAVYHGRIMGEPADLRMDLTNLTGVKYVTSDARGLEGGWTWWGRGRAVTIGIEQGF